MPILVFFIGISNLQAASINLIKFNYQYFYDHQEENQLTDFSSSKMDTSLINELNKLAWENATSNFGLSMQYADSALNLSEKLNWKKGKAAALNNLGEVLRNKGIFDEALKTHDSALEIYQELYDPIAIAETESYIGIVYFNLSDFSKAFKHFDIAQELYEKNDDKNGIINVCGYLGVVFSNFGQHKKALEYYEKALKLSKESGKQSKIAIQYNNIALTYADLKEYGKSIEYYKKALDSFKETGDEFNYSIALGNIGLPYTELQQYDEAEKSFLESLSLAKKLDDEYGIAHQNGNLGELYFKISTNTDKSHNFDNTYTNIAKAIKHLKISIDKFESLGAIEDQKDYLVMLSDAYHLIGNYKNSLESFKEAKSLQDSIQNLENRKVIAELEVKQDLLNKQKEIEILSQEKEYQNQITTYLVLVGFLVTGIAIIIFYFLLKNKKAKRILEKNIQLREKTEEELRKNEIELKKHQNHLTRLVRERTKELEDEILQHKQTEHDLLDAIERTEVASKAKSVFLANMSHELRTPLVGILGYSELLTSILEDTDAIEMADGINRTGNRLLSTLSLVLDLARIESDKFEIELSEVDIIKQLKDTYQNFKAMALKKKLRLVLNVHAEEFYHTTDLSMLNVIMDNLVNNAIKFTHQGEITIESAVENIGENANLIIRVSDTGVGMKKTDVPLIFEEFKQLSEGFTKDFQGSGLGLSITKKFISLLGGNIKVESEPGNGSKFTISFPTKIKAVA
ncbi:MAG: tetratricopeptide repeat protein [Ignavibacteriae bacterium]|nr:tetratricopeptide repeat protein [Ignavibacteriota bacterium]